MRRLCGPSSRNIVRQRRGVGKSIAALPAYRNTSRRLLPGPFKIIQTSGLTLIRNEYENTFRQYIRNGRKPPADPEPLWLGYSVGKWEHDTFIVDTVGFNDKSWLDGVGIRTAKACM